VSWTDTLRFAFRALTGFRVRTLLMLLAMSIGVAAVVLLTSLGEAARTYVTGEFAALGTNLLIVLPGRSETTGGAPPVTGATARDLTIEDAVALSRSPHVALVAPLAVGETELSAGTRSRNAVVMGSTHEMEAVRHLVVERGRFLPPGDPERGQAVAVLGATLASELFGAADPVGALVRLGDRRFRVVGVLARQGQSLGTNMDEAVFVPVSAAMALFDSPTLFRILVQAVDRDAVALAERDLLRILTERHEGEEDVTVITQGSVLGAFDRILRALTYAVAGIAAISLFVAGILVMNVMLVAVSQRTAEIGLLRALGAPSRRVLALFLTEAALLSLFGALVGVGIGVGGGLLVSAIVPALDLTPPPWAIAAAVGIALTTGTLFAVLPARRAAALDPVEALAPR
jgi:putative ABC transport system permease protein